MVLDEGRIERFEREGWCTTDPLFSAEECERIAAEFEALSRQTLRLGEEREGPLAYQPMLHALSEHLTGAIADARLLEIVARLVGPNARMYWEQLVAKPPRARTELPWHQDDGYAPTDPPGYLTCWMALDDADLENGCMWVIPGSHRRGILRHRRAGPYFRSGLEAYDGETGAVAAPVPRGAVLLFSSLTLHHSGPNLSDRPRRAWIVQYCDAAARHGNTGEALDDRPWVLRDGRPVERPFSERPIDVGRVFANWTPLEG